MLRGLSGAPLAAARACAVGVLGSRTRTASLRPSTPPRPCRRAPFRRRSPQARRTERPLRPAGTCWPLAARSCGRRVAKHQRRRRALRDRPEPTPKCDARPAQNEKPHHPAAAARKPCCAGPRDAAATFLQVTAAPRAHCTRRVTPNACDESRNHSPNQTCQHAPAPPDPEDTPNRTRPEGLVGTDAAAAFRDTEPRAAAYPEPLAVVGAPETGRARKASQPVTSRPLAPAGSRGRLRPSDLQSLEVKLDYRGKKKKPL